jgi:hypothetical protein
MHAVLGVRQYCKVHMTIWIIQNGFIFIFLRIFEIHRSKQNVSGNLLKKMYSGQIWGGPGPVCRVIGPLRPGHAREGVRVSWQARPAGQRLQAPKRYGGSADVGLKRDRWLAIISFLGSPGTEGGNPSSCRDRAGAHLEAPWDAAE